jgi:short-subunit dehydrogenase
MWRGLERGGITIDVLVNNAGSGLYGPLAEQDRDALSAMLELNVVALTMLTRLALPGMLGRRRGRILNVGSVTGYQPGGPRMACSTAGCRSLRRRASREPAIEG